MTMARMLNPPHPGLTLRDDVLPALGLGVERGGDACVWQAQLRFKAKPMRIQPAPAIAA